MPDSSPGFVENGIVATVNSQNRMFTATFTAGWVASVNISNFHLPVKFNHENSAYFVLSSLFSSGFHFFCWKQKGPSAIFWAE